MVPRRGARRATERPHANVGAGAIAAHPAATALLSPLQQSPLDDDECKGLLLDTFEVLARSVPSEGRLELLARDILHFEPRRLARIHHHAIPASRGATPSALAADNPCFSRRCAGERVLRSHDTARTFTLPISPTTLLFHSLLDRVLLLPPDELQLSHAVSHGLVVAAHHPRLHIFLQHARLFLHIHQLVGSLKEGMGGYREGHTPPSHSREIVVVVVVVAMVVAMVVVVVVVVVVVMAVVVVVLLLLLLPVAIT